MLFERMCDTLICSKPKHICSLTLLEHSLKVCFLAVLLSVCGPKEWTCVDESCIPLEGLCDGVPQCSDGTDETNCVTGGLIWLLQICKLVYRSGVSIASNLSELLSSITLINFL